MDKVKALENELVRDYHMRNIKAIKQKENAEEEYALMLKHFTELKNLSESRLNKILDLKDELEKLQGKYERDMAAQQQKYDIDMDIVKTGLLYQLDQCKKIFACEVEVLNAIVFKQQEDVVTNRVQMKQMATLLRVPRAHHKYISEFGAYDFIVKCEELIRDNDSKRGTDALMNARVEKRQKYSIESAINRQRGAKSMTERGHSEIKGRHFYKNKELEQLREQ